MDKKTITEATDEYYCSNQPVNVVPKKKVVAIGRIPEGFKVSEEVPELAVDVPDDVDGRLQFQQHGFLQKLLPGHLTQLADLVLGKLDLFGARGEGE